MLIFISFINTSPEAAAQMFIKIDAFKNFAIMMLTYRFPFQNGGIMILCHRSVFIFKGQVYTATHFSMFCKNKLSSVIDETRTV